VNKYIAIYISVFLVMFNLSTIVNAQTTMMGGKGLLRTFDAEPIDPGLLYVAPYFLTFLDPEKDASTLAKDHTLNIGFTVGISQVFEILAQLVPYQDVQKGIWGPPGDTRLGLKFHPPSDGVMQFGLLSYAKFPTARDHNVPFEPFSYDAFGWGLLGLLTFDLRSSSAVIPLKIHLNAGYLDHDANDRYFADKKDQLLFSAGIKFPIRTMILYSEFNGEFFINNTDHVPLSYNSMRFTQGLRFIGPWHLVCDIAADIGLSDFAGNEDQLQIDPFLKRYADWKVIVGVSYHTTLFRYLTKEEKFQKRRQRLEAEKLNRIRQEREKASKDLERIKKELEKKKP